MKDQSLFKKYDGIFEELDESSDSVKKKEKTYAFSPFALQDALGEKSAKKAWIEYNRLRFQDIKAEELIHKIVSKTRDMVAINIGATKEDLNIAKDYPYAKSKRDSKNWKEEELKNFYSKLIEIYHRSRMDGDELDIAIEKILLTL